MGTLNGGEEYKNILGVMLDSQKTGIKEFQGITGWREDFIVVRADKLRYADKDSIVLQFTDSTSNYGSSDIHILSVNEVIDEAEIVEDATILDNGIHSKGYFLYEETVVPGEITAVSMTSDDELIAYVEKLGTNVVVLSDYNSERTQYLYWNGEKWKISE